MEQKLSNEEILGVFAKYLPSKVLVKTPDGIGELVGIPTSIVEKSVISVHFGKCIHTKNSIDGFNLKRNHGDYLLKTRILTSLKGKDDPIEIPGGCQLGLKPLSALSENHGVIVAKILGVTYSNDPESEAHFDITGLAFFLGELFEVNEDILNVATYKVLQLIDQLREWGYALPYKGKSLFDLGIAYDVTKQ